MANVYQIELNGEAVDDAFYGEVVSLAVDESITMAGTAQLRLQLLLQGDGTWSFVDDQRFELCSKLAVKVGFTEDEGRLQRLFDGYITSVELELGENPGDAHLDIRAIDTSVLLSMEEKVAIWANLSDSDIVQQIVSGYGVRVDAESTSTVHAENDTTLVQRSSDIHFVRELARRNGFDFFFESDNDSGDVVAFFKPPQLGGTPQPDLAMQFGDESNLRSFHVTVSGRRALNVNVRQLDVKSASPNSADAATVSLTLLGAKGDTTLIDGHLSENASPKESAARMLLLGPPTSDVGELQTIAQGARNESGWLIGARGEINSVAYRHVLRAHRVVLVKGAGSPDSGTYYLPRARPHIPPVAPSP